MLHVRTAATAALLGLGLAASFNLPAQREYNETPATSTNRDDARPAATREGTMRGSSGTLSTTDSPQPMDAKERWARTHRASKLIGTDVRNRQGEDLGDIKELVLDPSTGTISYAVVSFGGLLGVGDKLFAIPWRALKLDPARNEFILDVDRERLRAAPGFDPDRWPDMASAQWNAEVHQFYGQPYRRPQSGSVGATKHQPASGTANDSEVAKSGRATADEANAN